VIPDLELVEVANGESFKVWSHGYPFKTVRWHFHPEYEIHLIVTTTGRMHIGDYIGDFQPGNLVMTGPNLPHNWVSDVPPGVQVPLRCIVLQFTAGFIERVIDTLPEIGFVNEMLAEARRGIEFCAPSGAAALPLMSQLLDAQGARRVELFMALLDLLSKCRSRKPLASIAYRTSPEEYMSRPLNRVLANISVNLGANLREGDFAERAGVPLGTFLRAFRRHTGMTFVQYVNSLRIKTACDLLMAGDRQITEICYMTGFNNVSNFNRRFLAQKNMSPSEFRRRHAENISSEQRPSTGRTLAEIHHDERRKNADRGRSPPTR